MNAYMMVHFLDRDVQYHCDAESDEIARVELQRLIREANEDPRKFEFYKEVRP